MKKLTVQLQNCFGIRKLWHEFDFSQRRSVLIYAPNGVMKSSFAKTFGCISRGEQPSDRIFLNNQSECHVLWNNEPIEPEKIFVSNATQDFPDAEARITTLLATKELKDKYDAIYRTLDDAKGKFLKRLKEVSKSSDCELELVQTFSVTNKDNLFDCLCAIQEKIVNQKNVFRFKYNNIFDKKGNVRKFLVKHKDLIEDYFNRYSELLSQSSFFHRGSQGEAFGTYQANQLIDAVRGDEFFRANHRIILSADQEITSRAQLEDVVQCEIKKILADGKIRKAFESIDKALGGNAELRAFKSELGRDQSIIPNLLDYEGFKEQVWCGYLKEIQTDVDELCTLYKAKRDDLKELLDKARQENETWQYIIGVYKERFHVPFDVEIENQEDVVLKENAATLRFLYEDDCGNLGSPDKDLLLKVLSQGERRAFYILQLLFELEARKKRQQETLIVFDDIADSFDYKNKYAIVEYIQELNNEASSLFYQIILTHNFDLYRTLDSRLSLGENVLMTIRKKGEITFEPGKYRKDFFRKRLVADLKSKKDPKAFVCVIPFIRNIIEYAQGSKTEAYTTLTHCLHIPSGTRRVTIDDITPIIANTILLPQGWKMDNEGQLVQDVIKDVARQIVSEPNVDEISLENKIVLSICIRILTEEYLLNTCQIDRSNISRNQTSELIARFKKKHPTELPTIKVLNRVNLMTPENIHVNTFMYEPLIDMSVEHLVDLYKSVIQLSACPRETTGEPSDEP